LTVVPSGGDDGSKAQEETMIGPVALSLLCAVLGAVAEVGERPAFAVGPLTVAPGGKTSGFLVVPAARDEGTRIPITVVHGTRPGPVATFIAGTHGVEYPPIIALQRVRRGLDAQRLAGTVILVHVANLPSFLRRTVYYSPVDGKNLNRVYPGRPDGTISERIAHVITTEVIEKSDVVVDMHGGDGNEALRPYGYWMKGGDAEVDGASRALLLAFGLDHAVIDAERPSDPSASVYTSNTAITRGKPAITTETGELGSSDERWVAMAEHGVWNVLRHLGMVDGEADGAGAVVWLNRYEVLRSPVTGMFFARTRPGYVVAEGTLLGVLTDLFGEPVGEVRAPFAGVVNYVIATPPISEGEPVAMVSRIRRDE
jgi:predicted deacylase